MTSWRAICLAAAAVVFALAIGIILGSGPLRTALTGQTAAQADALRGEIADRDAQLIAQQRVVGRYQEVLAALEPVAAQDRLAGEYAVLVVGPGVSAEAVAATTAALESAGATVTATATLSPAWLVAEQGAFRGALAEQIIADVGVPDATASVEQILGGALVQSLVPAAALAAAPTPGPDEAPLDHTLATQRASVLSDVLTRAELVVIERHEVADTDEGAAAEGEDAQAAAPPDPTVAVVLVGDQQDPADLAAFAPPMARLGAAFAGAGLGTVLVTGPPRPDYVGTVVAADREASGGVSVVADAWSEFGPLVIVLAAQEQRAGGAGIYGSSERGSLIPTP